MSTFLEPKVRIVGEQRAAVAAALALRYRREGLSIRALAADVGRSSGWVNRMLHEAGAEMRQRGGNRRPGTCQRPAVYVHDEEGEEL